MGNAVTFFEITGPDGQALRTFYSGVFGWMLEAQPFPGYAYLSTDVPGERACGIREEKERAPERVLYIRVPALAEALDKVVAAGGTVVIPPMTIPGGPTFALFADPAGNATGLLEG